MPTAKNLTYLRARNQGAVLETLLRAENISKQDLAHRLNLTPMSISYIAGDLLEKGILQENRAERIKKETPGRRGIALKVTPSRLLAIGVSVSRKNLCVSLVDLCGNTLQSKSHRHGERVTAESLTAIITDDISEILSTVERENVLGIGLSSSGLVDMQEKTIIFTTDFYGISNWKIGKILEEKFSLPCFVAEDMKAAGLAEYYYGAAKNLSDFIYLGITYGLGAGVIAGGKLLEGNRGFCGEVGHTTLYHDGLLCGCGNRGCAEMYLSVEAIKRRCGIPDFEAFVSLCEKEPQNAAVCEIAHDLSTLLVNIVNNFDAEAIVIGHEGAALPNTFFARVNDEVNRRILAKSVKTVSILPSEIPKEIHALNGAAIIFFQLFAGYFKL